MIDITEAKSEQSLTKSYRGNRQHIMAATRREDGIKAWVCSQAVPVRLRPRQSNFRGTTRFAFLRSMLV